MPLLLLATRGKVHFLNVLCFDGHRRIQRIAVPRRNFLSQIERFLTGGHRIQGIPPSSLVKGPLDKLLPCGE